MNHQSDYGCTVSPPEYRDAALCRINIAACQANAVKYPESAETFLRFAEEWKRELVIYEAWEEKNGTQTDKT